MPLPKISTPSAEFTFNEVLPISGEKIKLRFVRVAEQKLLLTAKDAKNEGETREIMADILEACNLGKVSLKKQPPYIQEWAFVRLIAASSGKEKNLVPYRCSNEAAEGKTCGHRMMVPVDYKKIGVIGDTREYVDFEIGDGWSIRVKRPDIIPDGHPLVWGHQSIVTVFNDSSSLYPGDDFSQEEIQTFWDDINPDISKEVIEYLRDAPRIEQIVKHQCESCGFEHKIKMSGLQSFF